MQKINRKDYLSSAAALAMILAMSCPAYAQNTPAPAQSGDGTDAEDASANSSSGDQNTIVVTGTSIRGAPAVGSNLISVGRDAIEDNAVQTVQQLLKTVPAIWAAMPPARAVLQPMTRPVLQSRRSTALEARTAPARSWSSTATDSR